MNMRRWVLLGIIAGCVIVVLLSMGDIWHRHKQAEGPAPSAGPSQDSSQTSKKDALHPATARS